MIYPLHINRQEQLRASAKARAPSIRYFKNYRLVRLLVRLFDSSAHWSDGVENTLNGYKLFDSNAKDRVLRVVEDLLCTAVMAGLIGPLSLWHTDFGLEIGTNPVGVPMVMWSSAAALVNLVRTGTSLR